MEPADVLDKMDFNNFRAGSAHLVEVTHINDPHSFYVRLGSLTDDVLMPQLEARGNPIAPGDLISGKRVIYKSKQLKRYVRGEIELISLDEAAGKLICTIFAIDYGCRDKDVKLKRIYLPASNLFPPLAIHCQLHLCQPKTDAFDQEAIEAMKEFTGPHIAKIKVISKTINKLVVELYTVECPDDVATMLSLLNLTTMIKNSNAVSAISNPPAISNVMRYKYKQVNVGDKLYVRVQSGDSISSFYVSEMNDYKKYVRESYEFGAYCKNQPLEDVVAAEADGRCCGVKIDMPTKYERTIVEKVLKHEEKAVVRLVDWGNKLEVNFHDIKCVSSEVYTILPAIAIYCSSSEDQTWKNGLPKFLTPGYEFVIIVIEKGNGIDVPHKVKIIPSGKK